jgi:hypothetical protein
MGGYQTRKYFKGYEKRKRTKELRRIWLENNKPKLSLINCTIFLWGW